MISITPISTKKPMLQIPVISGSQPAAATGAAASARADAAKKSASSQSVGVAGSARRADESRMVAKIQSDAILKSTATALAVSTTDILNVQVSPAGSVIVEGSMDRELASKLEAALQGNSEFVRAYKNASAVADTDSVVVEEGIEEYA